MDRFIQPVFIAEQKALSVFSLLQKMSQSSRWGVGTLNDLMEEALLPSSLGSSRDKSPNWASWLTWLWVMGSTLKAGFGGDHVDQRGRIIFRNDYSWITDKRLLYSPLQTKLLEKKLLPMAVLEHFVLRTSKHERLLRRGAPCCTDTCVISGCLAPGPHQPRGTASSAKSLRKTGEQR